MKWLRKLKPSLVLQGFLVCLGVGSALAFSGVNPLRHFKDWSLSSSLVSFLLIYFDSTVRRLLEVLPEIVARRSTTKPPKAARFLLWLFAKPKQRDAITDDLDEVFFLNVARLGLRKARWLYRWDVFRSIFASIVSLAAGLAVIRKLFHG